ncbi:MAG: S1 RNA-binding domain-containing protein [Sphingobacteriia bacterium]|nr:S1 RNA-binding domain-containing protein [Sphingobacteriia bacterium]
MEREPALRLIDKTFNNNFTEENYHEFIINLLDKIDIEPEKGAFKTRKDLLKVKRFGDKAFEQAAGFLRIKDAANPLDASAVHPESYGIVEKMAKDMNCTVNDLIQNKELRAQIKPQNYITEKFGLPTINDILKELEKPGRDPREKFEIFEFDQNVHSIDDLIAGMELPGIVTNITKFGAFVDIGVHQDGLVHISQIADRFIADPSEVLKLNQKVKVRILEVDKPRKRINLSMKGVQ